MRQHGNTKAVSALVKEAKRLQAVDRFGSGNPRAIINLIPEAMRQLVLDHQIKYPTLFVINEASLKKHLRGGPNVVTVIDEALRQRFWFEYDRVMSVGAERMIMENIYGNITHNESWDKYIKIPEKMAWIFCTPAIYDAKQNAYLSMALDEVGDILNQPHMVNNRLDAKLATLKFNIFRYLDERVNGSSIQRIASTNLTIAEHRMVTAEANEETQENLAKRLRSLERQERAAMHLPEIKPSEQTVIDVSHESRTDIVQPEAVDLTVKVDVEKAPEVPVNRAVRVDPSTLKPLHPNLNDPTKNHPKKSGGLIAD